MWHLWFNCNDLKLKEDFLGAKKTKYRLYSTISSPHRQPSHYMRSLLLQNFYLSVAETNSICYLLELWLSKRSVLVVSGVPLPELRSFAGPLAGCPVPAPSEPGQTRILSVHAPVRESQKLFSTGRHSCYAHDDTELYALNHTYKNDIHTDQNPTKKTKKISWQT